MEYLDYEGSSAVPRLDDCSLQYLVNTRLPPYAANGARGDERFASDGETLRLSLAGLLAFGAFPAWLATACEVISAPATSSQRRARLEADVLAS